MTTDTFINDLAAGFQEAVVNGWLGENWPLVSTGLFTVALVWGIIVLVLGEEYEPLTTCGVRKGS